MTTVDGLPGETRERLVSGFVAHGASQCGFCTPGILCRLAALPPAPAVPAVENALLAHLCRCTGWRSIVDAAVDAGPAAPSPGPSSHASARATLEGGVRQTAGPETVLGRGGFADDTAPADALVAVPLASATAADLLTPDGWAVGATLAEARAGAGKVQGRRSGQPLSYPVELPPGDWDITLQTTWVEPAYLEPDSSWCEPDGEPASPVANGGAFGAKMESLAPAAARMLADHHGRAVRVLYSREDAVRFGPKRPPIAAGLKADGTGVLLVGVPADRVQNTSLCDDFCTRACSVAPGLAVETIAVPGPAVSPLIRAAGWAEAAVLAAVAAAVAGPAASDTAAGAATAPAASDTAAGPTTITVTTPEGARATARVELHPDGWPSQVHLEVDAGDPLDQTVLRSYVQGAAHMAVGWVCSEGIAVDQHGHPTDLTIRSFGVPRAKDTPRFVIEVVDSAGRPPVRVSDAAFAAVAAAIWLAQGLPSRWPTMRGTRR